MSRVGVEADDALRADQLFFGAPADGRSGFRTLAATAGVSAEEQAAIESVFLQMGTPAGDLDVSFHCFAPRAGRVCVARLAPEPRAARAATFFVHALLLDAEAYLAIGADPFALRDLGLFLDALPVAAPAPVRLPPVSPPAIDGILQRFLDRFGAAAFLAVLDALCRRRPTVVRAPVPEPLLVEAPLRSLPVALRKVATFATARYAAVDDCRLSIVPASCHLAEAPPGWDLLDLGRPLALRAESPFVEEVGRLVERGRLAEVAELAAEIDRLGLGFDAAGLAHLVAERRGRERLAADPVRTPDELAAFAHAALAIRPLAEAEALLAEILTAALASAGEETLPPLLLATARSVAAASAAVQAPLERALAAALARRARAGDLGPLLAVVTAGAEASLEPLLAWARREAPATLLGALRAGVVRDIAAVADALTRLAAARADAEAVREAALAAARWAIDRRNTPRTDGRCVAALEEAAVRLVAVARAAAGNGAGFPAPEYSLLLELGRPFEAAAILRAHLLDAPPAALAAARSSGEGDLVLAAALADLARALRSGNVEAVAAALAAAPWAGAARDAWEAALPDALGRVAESPAGAREALIDRVFGLAAAGAVVPVAALRATLLADPRAGARWLRRLGDGVRAGGREVEPRLVDLAVEATQGRLPSGPRRAVLRLGLALAGRAAPRSPAISHLVASAVARRRRRRKAAALLALAGLIAGLIAARPPVLVEALRRSRSAWVRVLDTRNDGRGAEAGGGAARPPAPPRSFPERAGEEER